MGLQRVLVVDDNPADIVLVAEALRGEPHVDVESASSLGEALAHLERETTDVILLDLGLPETQGANTVAAVREAHPGLPIIVMSGSEDELTKGGAIAEGAQDYFVKGSADGALLARAIDHAVERQRLLNELEDARSDSLRQKDLFLSQVAHELRTPLNALSHFVTLVADGLAGEVNAEQKEYLDVVARNASQLTAIISDLTDAGRLQADKMRLVREPVDLEKLCRAAADIVSPSALERGIIVRTDISPHLTPVWADPLRVRQVLVNLLDNAVKYGPGGAEVLVEATTDRDAQLATVSVSDQGHSLTAESAARIFEQLVQGSSATASRKGLGLGLFIARQIVELHGGAIWVDRSQADRTSFRFTLPRSLTMHLPAESCDRFTTMSDGLHVIAVDFRSSHAEADSGSPELRDAAASIIASCTINASDLILPPLPLGPFSVHFVVPLTDDHGARVIARRIESELGASQKLANLGAAATITVLRTKPLPTAHGMSVAPIAADVEALLDETITAYFLDPIADDTRPNGYVRP